MTQNTIRKRNLEITFILKNFPLIIAGPRNTHKTTC